MAPNFNKLRREVSRLHRAIDARMMMIPKVCQRGCSVCCHQHIRIPGQEELVIEEFVLNEMSADTKSHVAANLEAWFDYFESNTPDGTIIDESTLQAFERQQAEDRFPCPFLVDGICSIYPTRPTVCRVHIEQGTSAHCESDPQKITEPCSERLDVLRSRNSEGWMVHL